MKRIDEVYTRWPFYGSRKLAIELGVNRKRVQRLMRIMGIEAVGHRRRTTKRHPGHRVYPYLLRDLRVFRPDQAATGGWSWHGACESRSIIQLAPWRRQSGRAGCGDITYIPLRHGFLYLVAVMDWFSRYVLSWRLSNTLEGTFCHEALDEALTISRPEIFNSDQGCQFTALAFTGRLEECGIAISMDGRGRAAESGCSV